MNLKEIRELIELIQESAIEEFEMEKSGVRIRVRKSLNRTRAATVEVQSAETVEAEEDATALPKSDEEISEEGSFHTFKAPIVGTFYLTPKPDAEPFVQPGDTISKGSVLCIIEAMKIFNQIESDIEGEILEILVESGQPVEYGEPLFKIRPGS